MAGLYLKENRPNSSSNESSSVSLLHAKLIISIVIIVEAFFIGLFCISFLPKLQRNTFGPEKAAAQYYTFLVNGQYSDAFACLELRQSEFVTFETFVKYCKSLHLENVTSYTVSVEGSVANIAYTVSANDQYSLEIPLSKLSAKKYGFFDQWVINGNDLLSSPVEILVLEGSEVVVDGIALSDDLIISRSSSYFDGEAHPATVTYQISTLFDSVHKISVSLAGYNCLETDFQPVDAVIDCTNMALSAEETERLTALAGTNMQLVFSNAISLLDFVSIQDLFYPDSSLLVSLAEEYTEYLDLFSLSSAPLQIVFENLVASTDPLSTSITLTGNYIVTFYSQGYLETYATEKNATGEFSVTFSFIREDGKWLMTTLGVFPIYY